MASGYLKNAAILTGAGLVLRLAGMGFRVLLAGRLGGEGMGLYQLVLSLYQLSVAAASSGAAAAAARLTAEELGRGDNAAALGMMKKILRTALALGCAAGAVQWLAAGPAARYWLGDLRAAPALRILSLSLPFLAVSAAVRGYFLGRRNVLPGARAQLAEQAVRIALVLALLGPALERGLAAACGAVVLGNVVSEALCCLLLFRDWNRDRRAAFAGVRPRILPDAGKRLRAVLWPVQGSRCLAGALQAAENMLVPACLTLYLADRGEALRQYGALRGMALPLLFFPFSFLSALSTLLLPEVTRAFVQGKTEQLSRLIRRMMFLTMTLSLPAAGLFCLYGPALGQLLYRDASVGGYLRVLGPLMPWLYLESMVDGVLKGLGQQMASFRYSVWDSLLRIGGVLLLLPRCGMAGFLAVMCASNLLTAFLNTRRMLRTAGVPMCWGRWVLAPAAALGLALRCGAAVGARFAGLLPELLAGGACTALVYGLLMLPLGLGRELAALTPSRRT